MTSSYLQTSVIGKVKIFHCIFFLMISLLEGCGRRGSLEPPVVSESAHSVSRSAELGQSLEPIESSPLGFKKRSKPQAIQPPRVPFFLDILLEPPSESKARGS